MGLRVSGLGGWTDLNVVPHTYPDLELLNPMLSTHPSELHDWAVGDAPEQPQKREPWSSGNSMWMLLVRVASGMCLLGFRVQGLGRTKGVVQSRNSPQCKLHLCEFGAGQGRAASGWRLGGRGHCIRRTA